MSFRRRRPPAEPAKIEAQRWAHVRGLLEPHERGLCTAPARRIAPRPRPSPTTPDPPAGALLLSDRALYAAFEDAWLSGDAIVRIPLESISNVEWRDPRRLGVQFTAHDGRPAFLVADLFRTRLAEGRLRDDLRAQLALVREKREAEGFWER
ncbi:MAG: hypothetical protein ACRDY6_23590 [Acidimicrobiia bacterium]